MKLDLIYFCMDWLIIDEQIMKYCFYLCY